MENSEVLNRTFSIQEIDLEKHFLELLSHIQTVKGYFMTAEVQDFLGDINPTDCKYTNTVLNGFYAAMNIFSETAETTLKKLYESHEVLKAAGTSA